MGPGADAASPSGTVGAMGGEPGASAMGTVLVSVEIRSTMLDRQSRLETMERRSLFVPPRRQNVSVKEPKNKIFDSILLTTYMHYFI